MRLLAKDPRQRPRSAEEVLDQLRRIENPAPNTYTADLPVPTTRILDGDDGRIVRHRAAVTPSEPLPDGRGSDGFPSTQRLGERPTPSPRRRWVKVVLAIILAAGAAVAAPLLAPSIFSPAARSPAAPERDRVYLTDLEPSQKVYWPFTPPAGPPGKPPPGKPPLPGKPPPPGPSTTVRVQGKPSPHGIFMHPPPAHEGAASLSYRLRQQFATFRTKVSLNDGPPEANMPCVFTVYGDGRELWRSGPVSTQRDAQPCSVSLTGVDTLTIEVRSHGDPRAAHAVWIEPYVAK
jgi:hypothetical protein